MSGTIRNSSESGYDRDPLSDRESSMLGTSVARRFEDLRVFDENPLQERLRAYMDEIEFTAQVAKAQFDQRFDGVTPRQGYFGVDELSHQYFGYTNWNGVPSPGPGDDGSEITLLDNSVGNNGGSGGRQNPLVIGENAVHIILGVGTVGTDPITSRVKFVKNDTPRPAITTNWCFDHQDYPVQFLTSPLVLAEGDEIYASYQSDTADTDSDLYLTGVSFVPSQQLRNVTDSSIGSSEIYSES